jgi:hypothetical protein
VGGAVLQPHTQRYLLPSRGNERQVRARGVNEEIPQEDEGLSIFGPSGAGVGGGGIRHIPVL